MSEAPAGRLVLVGTPIGNLGDCSERMRRALESCDLIVAEDTRRLRKLLSHLGIHGKSFVSYHSGNFKRRTAELLETLSTGATIALTTDAGMPLVSDPGAELVAEAARRGIDLDCIPGPSAVLQALVLSGFPASRFVFEGFVPRTAGKRRSLLETIRDEDRPVVVFESPHRLLQTLCDAKDVLGVSRRIAVCRELTKIHQEVSRTTVAEAVEHFTEQKARGEFVLVFGPATP